MAATATASFVKNVCSSVKKVAENKGSSWWYSPHMAASSRAIMERIPLVDLVLEVRDARIPRSSEYEQLRVFLPSSRHIIVLNKVDLASHSQTKNWMAYFEQQNCSTYCVNSHNKDNIKEFLNFLQDRVRVLRKANQSSHTTTIMLVGIPNVGKSALANSLHQIGRISAAEKGKLRHAAVSPHPGETKDITSFKIASHPNVHVLDTPGILPPEILDIEVCSRLALTGAFADDVITESELARYFLSILNLSDEYKIWSKLSLLENYKASVDHEGECLNRSTLDKSRKRHSPSDHTQDLIVQNVRRSIFEEISAFDGSVEDEKDLMRLIEAQFTALQKAFHVTSESVEDAHYRVATKLINLYRTGRLGHYTLDSVPRNA